MPGTAARPPAPAARASRGRTALLTGAVTAVAYLALLGWDQVKTVTPDGSATGPYEAWQVVVLVLVLAGTAAVAGWHRRTWVATLTMTVVLTLCWSYDAATDPADLNDGLWPVGALLVLIGTFVGAAVVAGVAAAVARRRARGGPVLSTTPGAGS
ncbi:hypothetical protein ACGIF2_15865 [Cellulomonas sp. P22]|uniref:hypothetical protein n=1 Tax=Cellulomonas sp. P22 TaxID=3373189 RepID=UPI0037BBC7E5